MKHTKKKPSCCSAFMCALLKLAASAHLPPLPSRMSHVASSGPFIDAKRKGTPRNHTASRWATKSAAPI